MREYKEEEKVIIWCLGKLSELESLGYIEGGSERLTMRGISEFDQIAASGWRPQSSDAISALRVFCGDECEMVWKLIHMVESNESDLC